MTPDVEPIQEPLSTRINRELVRGSGGFFQHWDTLKIVYRDPEEKLVVKDLMQYQSENLQSGQKVLASDYVATLVQEPQHVRNQDMGYKTMYELHRDELTYPGRKVNLPEDKLYLVALQTGEKDTTQYHLVMLGVVVRDFYNKGGGVISCRLSFKRPEIVQEIVNSLAERSGSTLTDIFENVLGVELDKEKKEQYGLSFYSDEQIKLDAKSATDAIAIPVN